MTNQIISPIKSVSFFVLFKLFMSAKTKKQKLLIVAAAFIFLGAIYKYGDIQEYFSMKPAITNQENLEKTKGKYVGEELTYNVFKKLIADYNFDETIIQRNYRPNFLLNPETNRCLEYDMYHPKAKIAVEYNGTQHYKFPNSFHKTEEEFKKQVYRDNLKKKISNEKNICLIVIPEDILKKSKNKELTLEEFIQPKINEWLIKKNKTLPGGFDVVFNDDVDDA